MKIDVYEWSIEYNKWIPKRHIEVDAEKIERVLSKGYVESDQCYKHVLEDGRTIFHVNPEFFEQEV